MYILLNRLKGNVLKVGKVELAHLIFTLKSFDLKKRAREGEAESEAGREGIISIEEHSQQKIIYILV